jgi:putative ABC transport system permease protein
MALRNLARNRRRTALTLAAIAVGLTAVVAVRGFLDGLQGMLVGGVMEGEVGALQVHKQGWSSTLEASPLPLRFGDADALAARLATIDGVRGASPRLTFPAMVSRGDVTTFARVTAVAPATEYVVARRKRDFIVGGHLVERGNEAVLGMELAAALGAREGDASRPVALLAGDVDGVLNAVDVAVVGRAAAHAQGEKRAATVTLDAGRELVRAPGAATEIVLGVQPGDDIAVVADRVRAAVGPGFEVHTWSQVAPFVNDVRGIQNAVLGAVTVIFLVVILLGVANTLLMSVLERTREIGTLMSLGMKRRRILALFVLEGLLLGIAGAVIGDGVGAAIITALAERGGVAFQPPGASLATAIVPELRVAFLVRMVVLAGAGGVVASFVPAWRASRLRPVEALAS